MGQSAQRGFQKEVQAAYRQDAQQLKSGGVTRVWDNVELVYDIFANVFNRKANKKLCDTVTALIRPTDEVLECACGTGLLTGVIAH